MPPAASHSPPLAGIRAVNFRLAGGGEHRADAPGRRAYQVILFGINAAWRDTVPFYDYLAHTFTVACTPRVLGWTWWRIAFPLLPTHSYHAYR